MTGARPGRSRGYLLVLVLVAALVAAGVGLYLNERESHRQPRQLGSEIVGDGVELEITAQEVDVVAQEVTLYTVLVPHGSLAAAPGSLAFSRAVEVTVASLTASTLRTTAGQVATPQPVTIGLYGGTPTDYPFDRYRLSVDWSATDRGAPLPVAITFTDADPFFTARATDESEADGEARLSAVIGRSRSTYILAWFMIAAMWALALAVLGGAQVLIRKRRPLVWPAMGWMAATLFALVGLRNAARGAPPIGSVIDYVAFFWAEGIIAASLACTVAFGLRSSTGRRTTDGPSPCGGSCGEPEDQRADHGRRVDLRIEGLDRGQAVRTGGCGLSERSRVEGAAVFVRQHPEQGDEALPPALVLGRQALPYALVVQGEPVQCGVQPRQVAGLRLGQQLDHPLGPFGEAAGLGDGFLHGCDPLRPDGLQHGHDQVGAGLEVVVTHAVGHPAQGSDVASGERHLAVPSEQFARGCEQPGPGLLALGRGTRLSGAGGRRGRRGGGL
ncbi:hypothetical protein ASE03_00080 [Kitasatospora sp. Root187]|uniref:DUF4436 family protein n=1 Tax=Kitasatospora sp. Root187 TaxID=1736486 RepID=UPI00070BF2FC|nr:DUF4436 family protein [Kitasatospora sp. Root187]KRB77479.1 hypothetical protein ASE03_00080 [Kitasatospora sp. Root187]